MYAHQESLDRTCEVPLLTSVAVVRGVAPSRFRMPEMSEAVQCAECEEIAKELLDALAELRASSQWTEISKHRDIVLGMLSGEDRFDELPDRLRFRSTQPEEPIVENSRVRDALWKMMEHMKRTGHRVLPV